MITTFRIHPEIESYIRKQSEEENRLLEESLLAEGCRDPLVVWEEQNVLVDGHHRIAICRKHGLAYSVVYRSFPDIEAVKAWMDLNQLGRRNLSKEDRDELIRRLAASGRHTQKEIAAKLGLTRQAVTHIIGNKANNLPENPIKSTSAAEELEAKQREIERLRAEKEALAERERKESQARMKAEGERLSLQNQLDGMVEMVKKEQSKKVEYITPPDVEDELETLRLENSRIAAALEEARKPQAPVALPDVKVVEKDVFVTPPEVEAELKRLRKQYEDEQRLESKKAKLEEDLARLRFEGDNERAKNTFLSLLDYIHNTRTATERIKAMAKAGTLTVEHLDESERLFMAMVAAGNDGMNTVREARGLNAENAGLRVVK